MSESSFAGIRTIAQVVEGTPSGTDVVALLTRLGLWTSVVHSGVTARQPFPRTIAGMTQQQLSNEVSYWTHELGRIIEVLGVLSGQKALLELQVKRARIVARARTRRTFDKVDADGKLLVKAPTATVINEAAEADPAVLDADDRLVNVEVISCSVVASKEATLAFLSTLSREITHRGDQIRGGLR